MSTQNQGEESSFTWENIMQFPGLNLGNIAIPNLYK